jgi:eukaryotic-like serine/threonine-protein kinase
MLGRRYQLEHELARGATGAVFRGRDVESGRLVAVKVVSGTRSASLCGSSLGPSARLPRAYRLSHPYIAAVLGCGRGSSGYYVVMECAQGGDLRPHVRPGALLPLPTVLSIAVRVAAVLGHAHRRGLTHGDVSPGNIVFEPASDVVKLVDFPLRKSATGSQGTPAYRSPEQVCGLATGPASDQFSLGVTLYRLACGELPFQASSRPRLAHGIAHERHTDIRDHDASLPASLAALLDKTLQKDPRDRYDSAADLRAALYAVAALPGCRFACAP